MALSPASSHASSGVAALVGCKVYNSAVQSINSGANTPVTFDSEEYDTTSMHSIASNTSRVVFSGSGAGYYLLTFNSFWSASPGTGGHFTFQANGTTNIRTAGGTAQSASVYGPVAVAMFKALATDYIEVIAFQNSGGAVNLGHASALDAQSTLTVTLLGT